MLYFYEFCAIYIQYIYNILCVFVHAQPCPTLCDPRDYSFPARTMEWHTGSEWPSSKNPQTASAGEGVEKKESSCTAGGNVN